MEKKLSKIKDAKRQFFKKVRYNQIFPRACYVARLKKVSNEFIKAWMNPPQTINLHFITILVLSRTDKYCLFRPKFAVPTDFIGENGLILNLTRSCRQESNLSWDTHEPLRDSSSTPCESFVLIILSQ